MGNFGLSRQEYIMDRLERCIPRFLIPELLFILRLTFVVFINDTIFFYYNITLDFSFAQFFKKKTPSKSEISTAASKCL